MFYLWRGNLTLALSSQLIRRLIKGKSVSNERFSSHTQILRCVYVCPDSKLNAQILETCESCHGVAFAQVHENGN